MSVWKGFEIYMAFPWHCTKNTNYIQTVLSLWLPLLFHDRDFKQICIKYLTVHKCFKKLTKGKRQLHDSHFLVYNLPVIICVRAYQLYCPRTEIRNEYSRGFILNSVSIAKVSEMSETGIIIFPIDETCQIDMTSLCIAIILEHTENHISVFAITTELLIQALAEMIWYIMYKSIKIIKKGVSVICSCLALLRNDRHFSSGTKW